MGLIDSGSKSNRLLASRRFTSTDIKTAQEAFTSVLDIQASEVYTQGDKVPSSGLPFSGSSQQRSYYSDGDNILLYYYRQRLTKSNVDSDVFFFMDPTGSNSGVTPQLIQDDQQTNFISPKYSVSSLANSTTEDSPPGYGVKVFKSTSTDSGSLGDDDVVSGNDYQFDYKTGVLQFDANKPGSSDIVYMTAYQYVGTTLESGVNISGDVSSSFSSTGSFGKIIIGEMSNQDVTSVSSSLSTRLTTAESELGNTLISSSAQIAADISGSFGNQRVGTSDDVTFASVTTTGNVLIGGNLDVDGTTTTIDSATLNIGDKNITIGSGSTSSAQLNGSGLDFGLGGTVANLRYRDSDTSITSSVDFRAPTFHGIFSGAISSSAQIAENISGSFTAASSSFSTRVTTAETELSNTLISSSAQIATDISGSFTAASSSLSSRITTNETSHSENINQDVKTTASPTFVGGTFSGDVSVAATASLGKVVAGDLTEELYVSVISTDAGNRYAFEGEVAPNFSVDEGKSYRFDLSAASVNGHPFKFSQTENGIHGGGSEYTTGVYSSSVDPGSAGSFIELRVDKNTPNHLYYYCVNHSGMGSNALILKNDMTNLHLVSGSSISTGSFGKLIGDGSEITNINEEDPNAIAFALALGG
tara:strand:+ start:12244 stop:14178 length:1935 start_codon:yes stop_codon:yes gene_type:complete